jgi:hypothetical protein
MKRLVNCRAVNSKEHILAKELISATTCAFTGGWKEIE